VFVEWHLFQRSNCRGDARRSGCEQSRTHCRQRADHYERVTESVSRVQRHQFGKAT